MTGDRLGIAPRVIGGALWGRIGGFVAGIVNSVVEWFTGKDIGDHIYAYFFGKPEAGTNKGIASKDGNGIGASVTTYPTDSLHKSEEGRSGRTALPQRSDVSRPLANSLRYESHLTLPPVMIGLDPHGASRFPSYRYRYLGYHERTPEQEHKMRLTA